jgi:hypothetical protein
VAELQGHTLSVDRRHEEVCSACGFNPGTQCLDCAVDLQTGVVFRTQNHNWKPTKIVVSSGSDLVS